MDNYLNRKPGSRYPKSKKDIDRQKNRNRNRNRDNKNNKNNNTSINYGGSDKFLNNNLVNIYRETIKICSKIFSYNDLDESICYDIYEDEDLKINIEDYETFDNTTVEVSNIDTLDMLRNYYKDGFNPLTLNMASIFKPGGGVRTGKTAQEEVIFRRSNAFMTHPEEWYPLEQSEVIYSPKVHIIRNFSYNILNDEDIYSTGMIAVPAIRKPKLAQKEWYKFQEDYDLMEEKIESIFKIALIHRHDSLILGALGCGAYGNPVNQIVEIFKKKVDKYKKYFKKIGFAVLITGSNDTQNYEIFKNELNVQL